MARFAGDSRTKYLLELIAGAFDATSWHGSNLRGSIRGLRGHAATWRPGPERHSIAEIVLHAAYWKYVVRRRLLDQPRGTFVHVGSNWFELKGELSEGDWREIRSLLDEEHAHLRTAVGEFDATRWDERPGSGRFGYAELVQGVAFHDIYHAGQIQLLKRLRAASAE